MTTTITTRKLLLTLTAILALPACETEGYDDVLEVLADEQAEQETAPATPGLDVQAPAGDAQVVVAMGRKGRLDFPTFTGAHCEDLTLANPFDVSVDPNDIRIQVAIDHEGTNINHQSTTVWVEDVRRDGARICVRETAEHDDNHDDGLNVTYRMFRHSQLGNGLSGRTAGNATADSAYNFCTDIEFAADSDQGTALPGTGEIFVSATVRHATSQSRDASSVWISDLDETGFTACMRETAHAGNILNHHYAYDIDWVAFRENTEVSGQQAMPLNNDCVSVTGLSGFVNPPLIFATIDRDSSTSNNAGTVWVEKVFAGSFKVCARGLVDPDTYPQDPTALDLDKANMIVRWHALSLD